MPTGTSIISLTSGVTPLALVVADGSCHQPTDVRTGRQKKIAGNKSGEGGGGGGGGENLRPQSHLKRNIITTHESMYVHYCTKLFE